jgi:hypothetical protein
MRVMHVLAAAAGLCAFAATTGCATERWPRSAAPARPAGVETASTKLRIAIEPFANESAVGGNTDVFTSWFLAGLVIVPHATYTYQWDRPQLVTFVHDPGRIFAIALYDQLRSDPNFEVVGFEPFEDEPYDVVLRGRIRRLGFGRWLPFVPLPFWVGSVVSLSSSKDTFISEIDLHVSAPMGRSALTYGLQAGCITTEPGCGPSNSEAFSTLLRRGYADFVARLDQYIASRGDVFWRDARTAKKERYYAMLDPTLAALDAEVARSSDARASELRAWRDDRIALLETLRAVEEADERAWAQTSAKRIDDEISETNANAERAQAAFVRAIALSTVITVAAGGVAAGTFGPNSVQVTDELTRARIGGAAAAEGMRKREEGRRNRLVRDALDALERAGQDRLERRRAWLAYYQTIAARRP